MADAATLALIIGPASAAVTGVIAYMMGKRINSGQVATTDADRLWAQNEKLIEALTLERNMLQQRVHDLEVARRESERNERECNARADRLALEIDALKRALKIEPQEGVKG